jgi:ATP-dependent helicase/nuclease subunit A
MNVNLQKNFAVYKSSAGSGKTYTLVMEYIRLVIGNPERYANILAITFTNKAANEMKSRILDYLKALAGYSPGDSPALIEEMLLKLAETVNLTPEKVSQRAGIALTLILHNYSNFAVGTIDSFVHRLVRSFARDLRLPVNFEVELDTDKLIEKSIDLLISKVGSDMDLTRALVAFIETKMEDEKSWFIENELKKIAGNLLNEESYVAVRKLSNLSVNDFTEISKKLIKLIRDYESELMNPAQLAMEKIDDAGLGQEAFYYKGSGIYSYFKRIANNDLSKISPNSYVIKTIDENKWCSNGCSADDADAIFNISDDLTELFFQIRQVCEKGWQDYNLHKLIFGNIYLVAVLSEIEKVMDEFRENENIVHISEFNKRISAIVQREAVPFIYERIGEKYKHYLLDEFQDTSMLQWHNLTPLIENSLSSNNFSMIVGDGKQAIYRWRNGEVEQFAMLPKIFKRSNDPLVVQREIVFESQYRFENLAKNYRSQKEIVDFNNDFFSFTQSYLSENLRSIYDGLRQEVDERKNGGYVQVEFLKNDEETEEDYSQKMLDRTLDIVRENLRHYTPEKIAVLTRKNDEGSLIASHLLQNGISVVSSEALLISAGPEVRFLISLMKFLLATDDKIAAGEALTFLFYLNKIKSKNLNTLLMNCREINKDANGISILNILQNNGYSLNTEEILQLTLPEIFDHFINIFNLDEKGNNPFIQFFMEMVFAYSSKYNETAMEFLKFWEEKGRKESIIIPESAPSVRVMTIHKAKGLQFPVVIYPFACEKSRLNKSNAWIEPELKHLPELKSAFINCNAMMKETAFGELYQQESDKSFLDTLNILYVAMTRPEERLYVLTKDKTKPDDKWNISNPFPDAADLLHSYLIEKGLPPDCKRFSFGNEKYSEKSELTPPAGVINITSKPKGGLWRKKMRLRSHASKNWDMQTANSPRESGLLIHRVLSMIITKQDSDKAIKMLLNEGVIQSHQAPVLAAAIEKTMSNPEISQYFESGWTVFNEKEILLSDGHILRPDRVVIKDDKIAVLDYKTGIKGPSHQKQMDDYVAALSEMGYKNIEHHIVYLNPSEN